MTDRGPSQDWFGSREIWIDAIIAAGAFWIFLIQTLTAKQPFFHRDPGQGPQLRRLHRLRAVRRRAAVSTTAILPSFMQNLLGFSALQSGYASMPRGLGSLLAFLSVPYLIPRIGPRRVLASGLVIAVVALYQMAHFDLTMTAGPIMATGLFQGFGVGLLFAPLNTLAYATLNPIHRTEGTIVNTMARSLGSSLGISMISATLTSSSAVDHSVPGQQPQLRRSGAGRGGCRR